MSALVRDFVARGLETGTERDHAKKRRFLSVGAGRSKQGAASPVSEQHDRALAKVLGR